MTEATRTVDATMDGRQEVLPVPDLPQGADPKAFDAAVSRAVDERITAVETRFAKQREEDTKRADLARTIACLNTHIHGTPSDDLASLQFKEQVRGLIDQVRGGTEKPHDEILQEAAKLSEARLQTMIAQGGDGGQDAPELRRGGDDRPTHFSFWEYVSGLANDMKEQGASFSYERLGQGAGNEEIEWMQSGMPDELKQFTEKKRAEILGAARSKNPRAEVIPVPMSAVDHVVDARFAETRAESVSANAERAQPTMRGDLLVPFFRPPQVLAALGAPMPIINNDQTLPRLSASLDAQWLGENAAGSDDDLTVVSVTSSPKRMFVRDDLSWMAIVGASASINQQALIVSEIARAAAQAMEQATFNGGGTNQPDGVAQTTGITAVTIAGNAPTYDNLLAAVDGLAAANIPETDGKWAITSGTRRDLATRLRFGTAMGGGNRALYEAYPAPDRVGGAVGGMMGYVIDYPAYTTNNLPVASNNHRSLFGSWGYVVGFQYGMAFLTIDDIAQANSGQTRITLNKYCDVIVRLPKAFSTINYNPTA